MTEPLSNEPLWTPTPERVASTQIDAFRREVHPEAADYDELWRWSAEKPGEFWKAAWDWCDILGESGERLVSHGEAFSDTRFLPDAKMNFAENLLAERPDASEAAILAWREDGHERKITWNELRGDVAAMASFFRAQGVTVGDRVAAWMPHSPETIIAFLAAASIGAVFTSTSADFGVEGVVDRFGQTKPTVLLAADGYRYGGKRFDCLARLADIAARLPSLRTVLIVDYQGDEPAAAAAAESINQALDSISDGGRIAAWKWDKAIRGHAGAELVFERLPGEHAIYILYSSGTTGKPKCIVHQSLGVLLKHLVELRLHSDVNPGDRLFFFTTCGWMMWNWMVSALGVGATLVLYDGNPTYPDNTALFDLADRYEVTLFGVSAKFIDASMKAGLEPIESHSLESIRTICSTGSPLSPEGFAWIYDQVKPDVHLASMSGGTDLCGCLVSGDPTRPVRPGEIQVPNLGMAIAVFDDSGIELGSGIQGELVCTTPFPSMPLEFWDDPDRARYRQAYFERFDGVWAHGDYASWTDTGGMVIHGRSDATLNSSGVRIGTAEIYRVVEQLPDVAEAIAVGQQWENDTRIVLFVRLVEGAELTAELESTIKVELRSKCSPRHVPAVIRAVPDVPRTRSGKIVELAVTDVIHGRKVKNLEALANPDALKHYQL